MLKIITLDLIISTYLNITRDVELAFGHSLC